MVSESNSDFNEAFTKLLQIIETHGNAIGMLQKRHDNTQSLTTLAKKN
jgi:hypothetical protein